MTSFDGEKSLGTLKVNIGLERAEIQCLCLNGIVGCSAADYVVNPDFFGDSVLREIYLNVSEALAHAHERNVIHLDVRPSNIIVALKSGNLKVMLGDWGCAEREGVSLKRFRGCPPYAHDSLLVKGKTRGKPWKPTAVHDMVSFAFTIAALHSFKLVRSKAIPWHGFDSDMVNKKALENRRQLAVNLLERCGLDQECRNILIQYIPPSDDTSNGAMQERVEPNQKRKATNDSEDRGTKRLTNGI
jgi:serine/threonine protein kinase